MAYFNFFKEQKGMTVFSQDMCADGSFEVEELYQAFKERLIDEIWESNLLGIQDDDC